MSNQTPATNPEATHPSGRDVCYTCFKAADFCICDGIVPVDNRTRIVIVQHKCERSHPIGTARIVSLGLRNTELRVVWPDKDSRFTFELDQLEHSALLFPGPGATDLADVPVDQKPRELVVLDGTWSDVNKLFKNNPWLKELPRYSLSPTVPSRYRIRKEPNAESVSTIEAIVQALQLLEPETPGLQSLIHVFEAMIDRQIECARSRPAGPGRPGTARSRNRERRSLPRELAGPLRNLVIVDEESVPWNGKKRELVRWSAVRIDDGSLFDQLVTPREGSTLTDDHLKHMGLCRDDMKKNVVPQEFARRWMNFITPGDILVTWNKSALDLLDENVGNVQKSFFLKEAYCNTRGGKCGHLKDVVRTHDLPLPAMDLKGRAAGKLSSTLAVTRYLNQLAESASDSPEEIP